MIRNDSLDKETFILPPPIPHPNKLIGSPIKNCIVYKAGDNFGPRLEIEATNGTVTLLPAEQIADFLNDAAGYGNNSRFISEDLENILLKEFEDYVTSLSLESCINHYFFKPGPVMPYTRRADSPVSPPLARTWFAQSYHESKEDFLLLLKQGYNFLAFRKCARGTAHRNDARHGSPCTIDAAKNNKF